ncbi:hypothetical protein DBV14_33090, partial [Variovorax sp. KBW07]
ASMWIGNLMLIVLNLPMIGIWIKLLTIPYKWLFPSIVLFCAVGVYSENNNTFDVWMVAIFGIVGYAFLKLKCEPAPLLLGFIHTSRWRRCSLRRPPTRRSRWPTC